MNNDLIEFCIKNSIPFTITMSDPWYKDYPECINNVILSSEKYETNKTKI